MYVIISCSKHGGVARYIHKIYSYFLRDKDIKSKHWEGLFIDVFGDHLRKPVTIANIYQPPKNNTKAQIQAFFLRNYPHNSGNKFQHKLFENQRTRTNPGLPWPIHGSWLYSANKLTDTSCTKIELSHRPYLLWICRRYSVSMFWNYLHEYIRPPTMLYMRWNSQI